MFNKVKTFLKEVKIELRKVVFPTRHEVVDSTKVLIIMVLIIAIFLGAVDLLLSKLVGTIVR
jgi:preprotein translocase subunit SecE